MTKEIRNPRIEAVYLPRTPIIQIVRKSRGFFGQGRSADILVRSKGEGKEGARSVQGLGALDCCCGQECPRSASVAPLPRQVPRWAFGFPSSLPFTPAGNPNA